MKQLLCALLGSLALAATCTAETKTFRFEGKIVDIETTLAPNLPIKIGDAWALQYTFDTLAAETLLVSSAFPVISMRLTLGSSPGIEIPLTTGHVILYAEPPPLQALYSPISRSGVSGPGFPVDGNAPLNVSLGAAKIDLIQAWLLDPTGLHVGKTLAVNPPNPADFAPSITSVQELLECSVCSGFQIAFVPLSGESVSRRVAGNIVSVSAVPEPGTYAMLLLGVGVIAVALRRRVTR